MKVLVFSGCRRCTGITDSGVAALAAGNPELEVRIGSHARAQLTSWRAFFSESMDSLFTIAVRGVVEG